MFGRTRAPHTLGAPHMQKKEFFKYFVLRLIAKMTKITKKQVEFETTHLTMHNFNFCIYSNFQSQAARQGLAV